MTVNLLIMMDCLRYVLVFICLLVVPVRSRQYIFGKSCTFTLITNLTPEIRVIHSAKSAVLSQVLLLKANNPPLTWVFKLI